jgi:hypothetical protein
VLAFGLVAGCSADAGSTQPAPSAGRSAVAGDQPGTRATDRTGTDPTATPTAKPSLPADPKAPTTVTPVARSGSHPGQRITARSAAFDRPVRWHDGVRLQVVEISHGVTDGIGAGATQGAPMTTFALKLTNGSTKPLNASSVVLTTVYGGTSRLVAQPVYGQAGAADFSGTIAPGSTGSATYVFSIPTKQLGSVSLFVDLDAHHAVGSFHGSVR